MVEIRQFKDGFYTIIRWLIDGSIYDRDTAVYVYVFMCMYVCIGAYACVHVCVCMYICVYVCVCVGVCACLYVHIHVCVYIGACTPS